MTQSLLSIKLSKKIDWKIVFIGVPIAFLAMYAFLRWDRHLLLYPHGNDWEVAYKPAVLELLAGRSPYTVKPFFNPPWVLLPIIPLCFLPDRIAIGIFALASIIAYGFVAWKLGANPAVLLLFLLTPQTLWNADMFNVDWMVALGFIMPPQIGLFFVLLKPQVGAGIALFWLFEAWQRGKVKAVLHDFGPVFFTLLLSVLFFGAWPLHFRDVVGVEWNQSTWPFTIPVGVVLLYKAIREKKRGLSIMATSFMSPYLAAPSYALSVLGLLPSQIETILAILGLWLIWFLKGPTQ